MRLGIVRLSDIKEVARPRGIKIAQNHIGEVVGFGKILQNLLNHQFRAPIRVYGILGVGFCDGDLERIAIGGASGAKDERAAAKLTHYREEIERVGDIV